MRGSLVFGVCVGAVLAAGKEATTSGGFKLMVEKLPSYDGVLLVKNGLNPLRIGHSDGAECKAQLEVAFTFDVTESFADDVPTLRKQIPMVKNLLEQEYPGSKIAVTSFRDKPITPLGYNTESWKDDCMEFISGFNASDGELVENLGSLYTGGGYDHREAQLEALMRVALAQQMVEWTDPSITVDPATGVPIVRMVILATDCTWHEPGDASAAAAFHGQTVEDHALPSEPLVLASDINAQCGTHEYPAYEQLARVLTARRIFPVVLTQPCGYMRDGKVVVFPEFEDAAAATGNEDYLDPSKGMLLMYTQLLEQLKVYGVVSKLEADASDLVQVIKRLLGVLPEIMCESESKTTELPATSTGGGSKTEATPTTTAATTERTNSETRTNPSSPADEGSTGVECDCDCEEAPCKCPCNQQIVVNVNLTIEV